MTSMHVARAAAKRLMDPPSLPESLVRTMMVWLARPCAHIFHGLGRIQTAARRLFNAQHKILVVCQVPLDKFFCLLPFSRGIFYHARQVHSIVVMAGLRMVMITSIAKLVSLSMLSMIFCTTPTSSFSDSSFC